MKQVKLLYENGYHEIGMDHLRWRLTVYMMLSKMALHRNFMGYSSSKTQLIGLGVSSISDSWYSFAQNVKRGLLSNIRMEQITGF
jgi:oxygen-independent coproporphyrinogen-3 oxidase